MLSHTNSLTSGSHHSALNVSLKTPGFITTNATADVLTSRQKYQFFVATNMSGNYPKVLIKTHAFVSPKRPEMSRLPIKISSFCLHKNSEKYPDLKMKISFFLMPQDWLEMCGLPVQNIQHLSHQNTSRNVLTSHHNICFSLLQTCLEIVPSS